MNQKIYFSISIILLMGLFVGCQEQNIPNNQNNFENITLESRVVELVNASLNFIRDNGIIKQVDVKYLFHNIVEREITITINVEFYDINNNLINRSQPKYISLLSYYTEKEFSPENTISFSGENASDIDHVKIIANE